MSVKGSKSNLLTDLEYTLNENEDYIGAKVFEELKVAYANLDSDVLDLESEKSDLQDEVADLKEQIADLNDKLAELEELKDELDELKNK